MKMCAQRKTGRRQLNLPSVPFPWSLAVHHQSLAFRARLHHAKNEAPEEEAEFFLENTAKPIFFIGDFSSEICERAETLRNIHQHMHYELCTFRDKNYINRF